MSIPSVHQAITKIANLKTSLEIAQEMGDRAAMSQLHQQISLEAAQIAHFYLCVAAGPMLEVETRRGFYDLVIAGVEENLREVHTKIREAHHDQAH